MVELVDRSVISAKRPSWVSPWRQKSCGHLQKVFTCAGIVMLWKRITDVKVCANERLGELHVPVGIANSLDSLCDHVGRVPAESSPWKPQEALSG